MESQRAFDSVNRVIKHVERSHHAPITSLYFLRAETRKPHGVEWWSDEGLLAKINDAAKHGKVTNLVGALGVRYILFGEEPAVPHSEARGA